MAGKGHRYVTEIDEIENPAARRKNLAGLSHTILNPARPRGAQDTVVQVRVDALDRRHSGCNRGLGIHDLRLGGTDRRFRRRLLRLGGGDSGNRRLVFGAIVVQDLL